MEFLFSFLNFVKNYEFGFYEQLFFSLLILIFLFLFYMGAFNVIVLKDDFIPPQTFLYKDGQDNYNNVGKYFGELYSLKPEIFKISHKAGLYHDEPCMVKNPNQARFSYGILVNQGEEHKISEFQKNFPEFKSRQITCRGKSALYPYRNSLSFIFAVIKVYNKFHAYFIKNDVKEIGSSIEIYDMINNQIKIMFPIGDVDKHQTMISCFPCPEYKSSQK